MKPLKLTPILLFILLLSNFSYSQSGWIKLNLQHTVTQNLTAIKIFDNDNFYIFADSNYVIKSTDGGTTLNIQPWNLSTSAVFFKDMNTGFAVSGKKLCRTQNSGVSWDTVADFTSLFQGQYFNITNLNFLNSSYGYITIQNSGMQWFSAQVYFTTDGGYNWFPLGVYSSGSGSSQYYTSSSAIDFKMSSPSTGVYIKYYYSATQHSSEYSYKLFKTINGGSNWLDISSNLNVNRIYHVDFINDNTGYATTDSSRFFKTTDGGQSWILKSYTPQGAFDLYMIDEMNGYVINLIDLHRTTDGGNNWVLQNPGLNITTGFSEVSFLNPQLGYIIGRNGLILKTTTGGIVSIGNNSQLVDNYSLSQNYPNPFNPETKIQFSIPKNGLVKIVVYDLLGQEVKELVNEFKQQGSYNVAFNAASLSSGVYFYKLITDEFIETKKMILVK